MWQSTTAQSQLTSHYLRRCANTAYKSHYVFIRRMKEAESTHFICREESTPRSILNFVHVKQRRRWLFITRITENWNGFFLASLRWERQMIFCLRAHSPFLLRQCVSGNQTRVFSPFFAQHWASSQHHHESTHTYLLLLKSLSLPDDPNFSNNIMQPLQLHNLLAKFIYCSFGWQTRFPFFAVFSSFSLHRFVTLCSHGHGHERTNTERTRMP